MKALSSNPSTAKNKSNNNNKNPGTSECSIQIPPELALLGIDSS
jgi:hypothetical protein